MLINNLKLQNGLLACFFITSRRSSKLGNDKYSTTWSKLISHSSQSYYGIISNFWVSIEIDKIEIARSLSFSTRWISCPGISVLYPWWPHFTDYKIQNVVWRTRWLFSRSRVNNLCWEQFLTIVWELPHTSYTTSKSIPTNTTVLVK